MAFFTQDFDSSLLHSTWLRRQPELRAQRLQAHNDFLYEVVRDSILERREELYKNLVVTASTARYNHDLSIPLWSYHAASYDAPRHALDPETLRRTDELLRSTGYQWFIGLIPKNAEFRYDEDGWDSNWRWKEPRPVHDVVRHTDFLQRIALLFGKEHYRVSYTITSEQRVGFDLTPRVMEVEIRLHFHPGGVYRWVRDSLERVEEKYATHNPATTPYLIPFVSKGIDESGFANRSPPSVHVPLLGSPPPLVRRSNGGGILDLHETARDLHPLFESAAVAPCHCGYHQEEED